MNNLVVIYTEKRTETGIELTFDYFRAGSALPAGSVVVAIVNRESVTLVTEDLPYIGEFSAGRSATFKSQVACYAKSPDDFIAYVQRLS